MITVVTVTQLWRQYKNEEIFKHYICIKLKCCVITGHVGPAADINRVGQFGTAL